MTTTEVNQETSMIIIIQYGACLATDEDFHLAWSMVRGHRNEVVDCILERTDNVDPEAFRPAWVKMMINGAYTDVEVAFIWADMTPSSSFPDGYNVPGVG